MSHLAQFGSHHRDLPSRPARMSAPEGATPRADCFSTTSRIGCTSARTSKRPRLMRDTDQSVAITATELQAFARRWRAFGAGATSPHSGSFQGSTRPAASPGWARYPRWGQRRRDVGRRNPMTLCETRTLDSIEMLARTRMHRCWASCAGRIIDADDEEGEPPPLGRNARAKRVEASGRRRSRRTLGQIFRDRERLTSEQARVRAAINRPNRRLTAQG